MGHRAGAVEGLDVSSTWTDAFRDKRVLITGHTGFKGSWLAIWLHRLGARVTGYALPPPTRPSLFEVARVRELLERHVEADVRDAACLEHELGQARPRFVLHLAAQPLVPEGYRNPRDTFETNVMGTVNVLEAVRRVGPRPCTVVVVTSDKCYEVAPSGCDPAPPGLRESDRLGGSEPYSASKAAAEIVAAAYRRSYFDPQHLHEHQVALVTVRAGNVIGGGDWSPTRIVPDVVRAAAAGRPVELRMPHAVRPWQHVLDPLAGYLTLAARLVDEWPDDPRSAHSGAWNFGPPTESCVTVGALVEQLHRALGRGATADSPDPSIRETATLTLCSDKARSLLGWRPRWPLDETIRRTADWYCRYYDQPGADMRQACMDDIAAYEAAEPRP